MTVDQMIIARQEMKNQVDIIDKARKELDEKIEESLGIGIHHIGGFSVTIQDTTEERFDSVVFKKENPELAKQYMKQGPKHIFKILELKK